tara:strand:- start:515 stop:823 length:309 start_codon:yes stop_codon:yes gene_type:complete
MKIKDIKYEAKVARRIHTEKIDGLRNKASMICQGPNHTKEDFDEIYDQVLIESYNQLEAAYVCAFERAAKAATELAEHMKAVNSLKKELAGSTLLRMIELHK